MSQILVTKQHTQKNKQLTFEDICPLWSRVITGYDECRTLGSYKIDNKFIDISHPMYCIVGEAHRFKANNSSQYNCDNCAYFAMSRFMYWSERSPETREKTVNDFVDHWNEAHVK